MHLKILIVDDDRINVEILETIACELGHDVETAFDGIQAVERFQEYKPDLVIMDINMPRMDGIEATRRIRALGQTRWVPIVFHSALDASDDIIRGLDVGGDDFLIKPTNPALIGAKIASYNRVLAMQHNVRSHTDQLAAWRDMVEEQNRLGQHVVSRLLDAEGLRDPLVQWMNTPADSFSGDLVCAVRGPSDVLYLMLADAAGHGLSAALSALPMTQIFYGMAGKGFSIEAIVNELNSKLKSFLPIERFVAASLVAVDTRDQTIEVWNGGNPDILFIGEEGEVSMRWPSRHPPLGILSKEAFNPTTETVNYTQPGELFMCSDGILEAETPEGNRLNQHGLEHLISAAPAGQRLDALKVGLYKHLNGNVNHDDLSSIMVRVPTERRRDIRSVPSPSSAPAPAVSFSNWRLDLSWGVAELRQVDVVPAVLGFMGNVPALQSHKGNLYLILSELFNNAMDHGLLALDSRLKQSDDGFERYLAERETRMTTLTEGRIDMAFDLYRLNDVPVLDIKLTDSGNGFDYEAMQTLLLQEHDAPLIYGRGILLVKHLCRDMMYSGCGNTVTARYELK